MTFTSLLMFARHTNYLENLLIFQLVILQFNQKINSLHFNQITKIKYEEMCCIVIELIKHFVNLDQD